MAPFYLGYMNWKAKESPALGWSRSILKSLDSLTSLYSTSTPNLSVRRENFR